MTISDLRVPFFFAAALLAFPMMTGCAGGGADDCGGACTASEECCEGACVFRGSCATTGMDGSTPMGVDSGPTTGDCGGRCDMAAERCCGGTCISRSSAAGADRRSDPSFSNCNGCGLTCDPERSISCSIPTGGSSARCLCGDLNQCAPGTLCVNNGGLWSCVDLTTNPDNCGALGNACADGEACVDGSCICAGAGAQCPVGQGCCGGACVDVTSDSMNCGACGNACGVAAPDCNGGTCGCGTGPACADPMPSMTGGSAGELCCAGACTAQTASNCGGCPGAGTVCGSGEECLALTGLGGFGAGICCVDPTSFLPICLGDSFPIPGFGDGGIGGGDGGLPFP